MTEKLGDMPRRCALDLHGLCEIHEGGRSLTVGEPCNIAAIWYDAWCAKKSIKGEMIDRAREAYDGYVTEPALGGIIKTPRAQMEYALESAMMEPYRLRLARLIEHRSNEND